MFGEYIIWWYSEGLVEARRVVLAVLYKISDYFSIDILFRTWFAPWKNDTSSGQNLSLQDRYEIFKQNFVTRIVGFVFFII